MAVPIKDLLASLFQTHTSWKTDLLKNWPAIIGELHNKVQVEKITDDSITLGVFDSCWLQELYLLSEVLRTTINQNLDQPRIKQVRFKKIGIPTKKQSRHLPFVTPRPPKKVITLTPRERNALEAIEDPQLRAALQDFLCRCYHQKG